MRIVNTYDQLVNAVHSGVVDKAHALSITYRNQITGRGYKSSAWQIYSPFFKTDPDAAWYDYGQVTFNIYDRKNRKEEFEKAKAFLLETYGVENLVRNKSGDYVQKSVNDAFPIERNK